MESQKIENKTWITNIIARVFNLPNKSAEYKLSFLTLCVLLLFAWRDYKAEERFDKKEIEYKKDCDKQIDFITKLWYTERDEKHNYMLLYDNCLSSKSTTLDTVISTNSQIIKSKILKK